MTKLEFISALKDRLSGLPQKELEERLNFYNEMIDDRIEEGIPEEEAIAEIGTIEEIAEQIIADTPLLSLAKKKVKTKRQLTTWKIVLIVVGSPIWFSILISLFVIVFSICVLLWAVLGSLAGGSLGGLIAGIVLVCSNKALSGIAMISAGFVCAGLSIFLYYGCKIATKSLLLLTKKFALWLKNCFIKKEVA